MKKAKKYALIILMLLFTMMLPITANAAVKLNKKSVTLTTGKTETLKITGTKSKVKWKSSNSKIASVNSKGKVLAKAKGTATITATVLKKNYKCKITVKKAAVSSSHSGNSQAPAYVWLPRTGSKYHRTSTCSRMKSPRKVSLEKAVSMGYEPCKKCF